MFRSKILIIEDDAAIARVLQDLLTNSGYEIVGFTDDGTEALLLAEVNPPDVVLIGTRLKSKIDGISIASLINERFDIPIIYLSAQAEENTLSRSKATGPFAILFNPLDEKTLTTSIEIAIDRHAIERQLKESKDWLSTILTSVGDGLIAVNEEGSIRFFNPIAANLTGWTEKDTFDKKLDDVFKTIDETSLQPVDCTRLTGLDSNENHRQILLVTKTGQTLPIEAVIAPIRSVLGKTRGMVIAFRDTSERRKAIQEISQQASRANALARVAARLNSQLNLQDVLQSICEETAALLSMPASAIYLRNETLGSFQAAATYNQQEDLTGFGGKYAEIPAELILRILDLGTSVVHIPDLRELEDLSLARDMAKNNFRTIAIAPLYLDGEIVGILSIVSVGYVFPLSQKDLDVLRDLSGYSEIAIANARLFEQVRAGREHMQALSHKLVEVQEAERSALARELHDQVGQMLTGMQYTLESSKYLNGDALKASLDDMQAIVKGLMSQIREMSLNLRPSMLDDLGLLPTLLWHFDRYTQQTRIQVAFTQFGLEKRFTPAIETAIYRIVQEALTNVARYAGCEQVDVRVIGDEESVRVQVWDKGKGFDPATVGKQSLGLNGMRERANLLGGIFKVHSAPGDGTQIVAVFPIGGQLERRKNAHHGHRGR